MQSSIFDDVSTVCTDKDEVQQYKPLRKRPRRQRSYLAVKIFPRPMSQCDAERKMEIPSCGVCMQPLLDALLSFCPSSCLLFWCEPSCPAKELLKSNSAQGCFGHSAAWMQPSPRIYFGKSLPTDYDTTWGDLCFYPLLAST